MPRESCAANEHSVSMEIKLWEPGVFRSQSQCKLLSGQNKSLYSVSPSPDFPSVTQNINTDIVQRACYEQLCH